MVSGNKDPKARGPEQILMLINTSHVLLKN
jgi:hypothetical protein